MLCNSTAVYVKVGARNVKFGTQIGTRGTNENKCKIRSNGVGKGSRDLLLKFWDSSISRERLKLETSNLACKCVTRGTNENKCKIRSNGVGKGSRDLLLKFWDSSISRERLELETSNLACRCVTRGTNEGNAKLG